MFFAHFIWVVEGADPYNKISIIYCLIREDNILPYKFKGFIFISFNVITVRPPAPPQLAKPTATGGGAHISYRKYIFINSALFQYVLKSTLFKFFLTSSVFGMSPLPFTADEYAVAYCKAYCTFSPENSYAFKNAAISAERQ